MSTAAAAAARVGGARGDWGEISGSVVSAASVRGESGVVCNIRALYGHSSSLFILTIPVSIVPRFREI